MAFVHPDFIQSIIKDNGDKTYTISMYDPMGKPIEVSVTSKFLSTRTETILRPAAKMSFSIGERCSKALMKYRHVYWKNYNLGGIPQQEVNPLFTGKGDLVYCWGPGNDKRGND